MADKVFFHVDLDAFFAAVEVLDDPTLKGKPLIIGYPGRRSVVSTCSYEARKYGVHSAMPMVTAVKLCPNAVFVSGHMKRYSEKSREVMNILKDFAPSFLQASVDEAYLDMSGTERIYGKPREAAKILQDRIFDETGLTASIGIGGSKFIAKLGSDYKKPRGITYVPIGREIEFIDTIGLKKLWGIGKAGLASLEKKHIRTTKELRELSESSLTIMFGNSFASYLYKVVRGIDPGIYSGEVKSRSISTERTFIDDLFDKEIIYQYLLSMSQELMFRSLDEGFIAKTICIKIRYGDFSTTTIQTTPSVGIYSANDVYDIAIKLFNDKYENRGLRLLGLSLSQLYEGDEIEQRELFSEVKEKQRALEKTILNLSKKGSVVTRARILSPKKEENIE